MSRSRPPKCPNGRGCGVCTAGLYEKTVAELVEKFDREQALRDADEYRELPHYPFQAPDEP